MPSRVLLGFAAVVIVCACHGTAMQRRDDLALAPCPQRGPSSPRVGDSVPGHIKIREGADYAAGDRVVIVVDDTMRGIVLAQPSSGRPTPSLGGLPSLATLKPDDIADVYVLSQEDARTWAAPCEVERGVEVHTKRSLSVYTPALRALNPPERQRLSCEARLLRASETIARGSIALRVRVGRGSSPFPPPRFIRAAFDSTGRPLALIDVVTRDGLRGDGVGADSVSVAFDGARRVVGEYATATVDSAANARMDSALKRGDRDALFAAAPRLVARPLTPGEQARATALMTWLWTHRCRPSTSDETPWLTGG